MFETANKILKKQLSDNWSETDIDWDNSKYKPVIGTPYIRYQLVPVTTELIAQTMSRFHGYALISIFVEKTKGDMEAYRLATNICGLFTRFNMDGIECQIPNIVRVGQQAGWYQLNVHVPFFLTVCS